MLRRQFFDKTPSVPEHFNIPTTAGAVHVALSEPVRSVLREIKRLPGRRAVGARAEAFMLNPLAALGEHAAEAIDPDQFAQARKSAGIEFDQFRPFVDRDALGHPAQVGLKIDTPRGDTVEHAFATDGELGTFVANLEQRLRDGRDAAAGGGPPNNWLSAFGGSGWELDPATRQYYYHTFLSCQPDLNWRNPEVREAIKNVMRFWFAKGVDGFRMDALWCLLKDQRFRDNPPNPDYRVGEPPDHQLLPLHTTDLPEIHEAIADLRSVADAYGDRLLIGEIYLPPAKLVAYYGKDLEGVHLPFNFSLLEARWDARTLATLIDEYEGVLPPGSWPNWVLGNHDRPRIVSRVGPEQARVAAMLLLTLRGTPTLYNGDELGMPMAHIPPDRVLDPFEVNVPMRAGGSARPRSSQPSSLAPASRCARPPAC